ncbi:hypothetical protein [Deinococcus sp. 6GRE01]|uniref:hypothetical protein n=1 Tax=Deinococcus sp. 6GRE01 TaxID=2745873 RepID=UPI001E359B5C|nr:hypothetical protein [Deinococcus sp. 6GRE01]MCD0155851.1 hypothetical protein [Deinococcus sp. 6GRE01]
MSSAAPDLFSFDFSEQAIQVGDIVRQAWPWILTHHGHCIPPFWQVRGTRTGQRGQRLHLCMAVPYTLMHGTTQVFEEYSLERTGANWRVPSHHEVQMWFQDLGTTLFASHLNSTPPRATHPAEAELISLVEHLGPVTLPNNRAAWYEQFPSPTIEEWRERARAADL